MHFQQHLGLEQLRLPFLASMMTLADGCLLAVSRWRFFVADATGQLKPFKKRKD